MSRSNRQLARLVQELIKAVQTGRLSIWWILGGVSLVVGYFLLQPVLQRSLGVDLPGLSDVVESDFPSTKSPTPRSTTGGKQQSQRPSSVDRDELQSILQGENRRVFVSPAGLRYTRGSQHGHRLKHLLAHIVDEPDRPGQHGVFDASEPAEVVALVDEAYQQALAGRDTQTQREDDRMVYDVNLRRRIGYIGGESGQRRGNPAAQHLRLVVQEDRFITAFPVRP